MNGPRRRTARGDLRPLAGLWPERSWGWRSETAMASVESEYAGLLRGIEHAIHESLDAAFESHSGTRRQDAEQLLRKSDATLRSMLDTTEDLEDRRAIVDTLSHVQDLQDQLALSSQAARSAARSRIASPIARLISARRGAGRPAGAGEAALERLFRESGAGRHREATTTAREIGR